MPIESLAKKDGSSSHLPRWIVLCFFVYTQSPDTTTMPSHNRGKKKYRPRHGESFPRKMDGIQIPVNSQAFQAYLREMFMSD